MSYMSDLRKKVGHVPLIYAGSTLLVFNDKKADGSASRGEIRSIILALKFIEARILEQEVQKRPVVLLDDMFSELDEMRQQHLVENFKDYQMIITSTTVPRDMSPDVAL